MKYFILFLVSAVCTQAQLIWFRGQVTAFEGFTQRFNTGDPVELTLNFNSPHYGVVENYSIFDVPITLTIAGEAMPLQGGSVHVALLDGNQGFGNQGLWGLELMTAIPFAGESIYYYYTMELIGFTDFIPSLYEFPTNIPMSEFFYHNGFYQELDLTTWNTIGSVRWDVTSYGSGAVPEPSAYPLVGGMVLAAILAIRKFRTSRR